MKILFITDSPHWALANRARNLKKNIKNQSIDIYTFHEVRSKNIKFDKYNIVYSLNWPIHGYIQDKISKKRNYRLYTTICSHIGRPHASKMKHILDYYDGISCSNKFIYNEFKDYYKNVFYTPFGVDSSLFIKNSEPEEFIDSFGWAGNHKRSVKRFDKIRQAVNSSGGKFVTAKQDAFIPHAKMPKFYNGIGTLICFSESEGTPNPVIEAAACGRLVISTPVGNVPQINQSNNIIIVKNEDELRSAIKSVLNKDLNIKKVSNQNRKIISENWDWNILTKNFERMMRI